MKEFLKRDAKDLLTRIRLYEKMSRADIQQCRELVMSVIEIISVPYRQGADENAFVFSYLNMKKSQVKIMDQYELSRFSENCICDNDVIMKIVDYLTELDNNYIGYTKGFRNYYTSEIRSFNYRRW